MYHKNPEPKRIRERRKHYMAGGKPMSESKDSAVYLGVYVAERVLANCGLFQNIERMPFNYPGIDFRCGKGYGIDVKCGCLSQNYHATHTYFRWQFSIRYNKIADYFLLLGFRDRDGLEPQHVWLIPAHIINHLKMLHIYNSDVSLAMWSKYEQPLDKVLACCQEMRGIS
jgi:hypothetical protein